MFPRMEERNDTSIYDRPNQGVVETRYIASMGATPVVKTEEDLDNVIRAAMEEANKDESEAELLDIE